MCIAFYVPYLVYSFSTPFVFACVFLSLYEHQKGGGHSCKYVCLCVSFVKMVFFFGVAVVGMFRSFLVLLCCGDSFLPCCGW